MSFFKKRRPSDAEINASEFLSKYCDAQEHPMPSDASPELFDLPRWSKATLFGLLLFGLVWAFLQRSN